MGKRAAQQHSATCAMRFNSCLTTNRQSNRFSQQPSGALFPKIEYSHQGTAHLFAMKNFKTPVFVAAFLCVSVGAALWRANITVPFAVAAERQPQTADAAYVPLPKGSVTFNKHIAPIVFSNCSPCHRTAKSRRFRC
jgi:hypothetical protein